MKYPEQKGWRPPELTVGAARVKLPIELRTGDYAECGADGPLRVQLQAGARGSAKFTLITGGAPDPAHN